MAKNTRKPTKLLYDSLSKKGEALARVEWDFSWISSPGEEYLVALYEYGREAVRKALGKATAGQRSGIAALVRKGRLGSEDLGFVFSPGDSPQDRLLECLELIGRFGGQPKKGDMPLPASELMEAISAVAKRQASNMSLQFRVAAGKVRPVREEWEPQAYEFTPPSFPNRMTLKAAVAQFESWARSSGEFLERGDAGGSKPGRPGSSDLVALSYYRFTQGRKKLKACGDFGDAIKSGRAGHRGKLSAFGLSLYAKEVESRRRSMNVAWSNGLRRADELVSWLADELIRCVSRRRSGGR
jgi:hypothetical protein